MWVIDFDTAKSGNLSLSSGSSSKLPLSIFESPLPVIPSGLSFKNDFTSSELEDVLNLFDAEHIAVGHSTQKKIVQLHENRIFGIDTGIKKGKSGEVLLIEGDRFYGGSINGQLRELNQWK